MYHLTKVNIARVRFNYKPADQENLYKYNKYSIKNYFTNCSSNL